MNNIIPSNTSLQPDDLFSVRTANEWLKIASERPIPKRLFYEFWYENEVCILFADTNQGKSILAVQIANNISRTEKDEYGNDIEPQKVLYFDFELSDKQFEARYSEDFTNHYEFSDNFIRLEMNSDAIVPDDTNFEDYLFSSIEQQVLETGSKVLIIDNITYLKNETENAKSALPLMKELKALKNKHNLSILCLAHTPKRDLSKPITRNDLQGSKMLINFCDSAFAIGESQQDSRTKYLKQIKARNTEIKYDADNVAVFEIDKRNSFLGFEMMTFANEHDHLKRPSTDDKEEMILQVKELVSQGVPQREIAKQLGIGVGSVNRYAKR